MLKLFVVFVRKVHSGISLQIFQCWKNWAHHKGTVHCGWWSSSGVLSAATCSCCCWCRLFVWPESLELGTVNDTDADIWPVVFCHAAEEPEQFCSSLISELWMRENKKLACRFGNCVAKKWEWGLASVRTIVWPPERLKEQLITTACAWKVETSLRLTDQHTHPCLLANTHTLTHIHTCVYMHTYMHIYVHTYMHTHAYRLTHTHKCTHIYTSTCSCMYTFICTCIHTYMHTHTKHTPYWLQDLKKSSPYWPGVWLPPCWFVFTVWGAAV